MEPGGKGSFQAVKLQSSARATVCSHSARDMAAMVLLYPFIIIAVRRTSICTFVNSYSAGTKTKVQMSCSCRTVALQSWD